MSELIDYGAAFPGPDRGKAWAALWLLVVLPVAFAGWGVIVRGLLRLPRISPAALPALGLATFILAGGALNLLRIAFPWAIALLLILGFIFGAVEGWNRRRSLSSLLWPQGKPDLTAWLLAAFVAAFMLTLLVLQVSPSIYNWRDDLEKYFVHPVRMLESGTVYGSPLSALGSETLGALAVVDSAVLIFLPLRDINGADAIVGFLFCIVPVVVIGLRERSLRAVAALAIASMAFVDASYVNISALYLGSALIAGAVILLGELRQCQAPRWKVAAVLGLMYAGLIALKPTFVLFVALHLGCDALFTSALTRSLSSSVRRTADAVAAIGVFLAPWILLHLPHYIAGLERKAAPAAPFERMHLAVDLWGTGPLVLVVTGLRAYTILVAVLLLLALVCAVQSRQPGPAAGILSAFAGAAIAAALAYPIMLFVFPRVIGYADGDPDAVRYFIPFALGTFPVTLCLAADAMWRLPFRNLTPRVSLGVSLVAGLVVLCPFSETAALHCRDLWRFGNMLPFAPAHDPILAERMGEAIGGPRLAAVRDVQSRVPEGASIVAWTNMPYLLDYGRNRIFDAEVAGIASAWATIPPADYVIWEFRGNPDPRARTHRIIETLFPQNHGRIQSVIDFDRELAARVGRGTIVFRNDEFLVCRLQHDRP